MSGVGVMSCIVILLFLKVMALACSYLSPLVIMDRHPRMFRISPAFLQHVVPLTHIPSSNVLFPYWAYKFMSISTPLMPSDRKKRTTSLCSSLVHTENGAAMFSASLLPRSCWAVYQHIISRFSAANCRHAVLYVLPAEAIVQIFSESPSWETNRSGGENFKTSRWGAEVVVMVTGVAITFRNSGKGRETNIFVFNKELTFTP